MATSYGNSLSHTNATTSFVRNSSQKRVPVPSQSLTNQISPSSTSSRSALTKLRVRTSAQNYQHGSAQIRQRASPSESSNCSCAQEESSVLAKPSEALSTKQALGSTQSHHTGFERQPTMHVPCTQHSTSTYDFSTGDYVHTAIASCSKASNMGRRSFRASGLTPNCCQASHSAVFLWPVINCCKTGLLFASR